MSGPFRVGDRVRGTGNNAKAFPAATVTRILDGEGACIFADSDADGLCGLFYARELEHIDRPEPATTVTPTVTMSGAQYIELQRDRDSLAARVDELLLANNREVEERRRLKGELATVTADRDEWVAAFRDLNHRAMRLEGELRAAKADAEFNARAVGYYRDAVSARPAPDKGKWLDDEQHAKCYYAADPENYVLGPWRPAAELPIGAAYQWRDKGGQRNDRIWLNCEDKEGGFDAGTEVRRAYRIGEWHDWDGSRECPVDGNILCDYRMREREAAWPSDANILRWHHINNPSDIIAFRPVRAS